jgi:Dolichyl-phosphate-mannose-protein mannosyltransferase
MGYRDAVREPALETPAPVARLHRFVFPWENCALWIAAGLAVFVLCSSLWIAYRRAGWYDEVLVLTIARLPSTRSIFEAISASASSLPPFYFVLVRLADQMFGPNDGAARIPSAIAAAAGMFVTFDCAQRLTNSVNALVAMALLLCSFLPYYGYEARPYALCFFFSAMGLWLWSHPRGDRRWMAALFGATFFLGFCFHYYTALTLIPYAVFEAVDRPGFWRPSRKLIAATMGVIGGILVCGRFMVAARKFSHGFWSPPSFAGLRGVFAEIFPAVLLAAAVSIAVLAIRPGRGAAVGIPMLRVERLGWLFLLVPLAGFAIAVTATNAFVSRYFIGILPGIAVAFACTLWRHFHGRPAVSAAVAASMLVIGCAQQAKLVAHPDAVRPPGNAESPERWKKMVAAESALLQDGKTAIVVSASDTLAMEAAYFSRHAKDYVLLLPAKEDMVSRAHRDLARFHPLTFWTMEDLQARAASAALINPSHGVLGPLSGAGFRLQFIDSGSDLVHVFYLSRP